MNAVPEALGSRAWADELPGEVYLDPDTDTLSIGFIYGDLSAPVSSLAVCGPAPAGENAVPLLDLAPYHLPLGFPPTSGFVFASVRCPASHVTELLQGLHYVRISSGLFPEGALRAQLIPPIQANSAPTVACAESVNFQCGESGTVTAQVADADGDPLVVVWEWNGWPVETNLVGAASTAVTVSLTAEFPPGDGVLSVRAIDPDGADAVCTTLVSVADTVPPVVESALPEPAVLWPPNHKMVPVTVEAQVVDECGDALWTLVSVVSNEPDNGKGDGNSSADWQILDEHTVLLRAERSGSGHDRVYTLGIQAVDLAGNWSDPSFIQVVVPH